MRHSALIALTALLALPVAACEPNNDTGTPDRRPFRDEWVTEVETDFVHTSGPDTLITELTIGGKESNDNFANRGDVTVNFDGPPNKIRVEFRRFTTNTTQAAAQEDFDAISLWAYNTGVGSPSRPSMMDEEDNCNGGGGWLNNCGIRLYYDGQTQLGRAGADIRVTLPADYRRSVRIITEDADEDGDYLNRGNVCVKDTNGAVDVKMQSGEAFVIVSDEATPAPACGLPPNTASNPSTEVQDCNNYEKDGMNAAWDVDCKCATDGVYGVVKVESETQAPTNITVDVPETLWAAITVQNQGKDPSMCTGTITVPGLIPDETGNEKASEAKGTINPPSDRVTMGAGYNIQARSGECGSVFFTENPDDFVGINQGSEQKSETRGNIEVCADCIRAQSCEDLLN